MKLGKKSKIAICSILILAGLAYGTFVGVNILVAVRIRTKMKQRIKGIVKGNFRVNLFQGKVGVKNLNIQKQTEIKHTSIKAPKLSIQVNIMDTIMGNPYFYHIHMKSPEIELTRIRKVKKKIPLQMKKHLWIDSLKIESGKLTIIDKSLKKESRIELTDIQLKVDKFSSDRVVEFFSLSKTTATLGGTGKIKITSDEKYPGLHWQIELKKVPLKIFSAYLENKLSVSVEGGTLDATIDIWEKNEVCVFR